MYSVVLKTKIIFNFLNEMTYVLIHLLLVMEVDIL